ncbi:MAG: hypothetical protein IT210_19150 [Armatimonadetes bacterium]|nr:hypothetical protein [Armatimonadota bacterium]
MIEDGGIDGSAPGIDNSERAGQSRNRFFGFGFPGMHQVRHDIRAVA